MAELAEVGLEGELLESNPGRATVVAAARGRGSGATGPRGARPPRRRAGQRRRLAGRPLRRRGARRLHLGARRRRHEGHGRDDPRDHPRLRAHRDAGRPGRRPSSSSPTRRPAAVQGSHWLVDHHPSGSRESPRRSARSAATASPCPTPEGEQRAYLLQTAEKGIAGCACARMAAPATGRCPTTRTPSCGSPRPSAASRRTSGPASTSPRSSSCSTASAGSRSIPYAAGLDPLLAVLGGAQGFVRGTLHDTANVTMLEAGYKHNVIPQTASAAVDCRFLPGHEDVAAVHDP